MSKNSICFILALVCLTSASLGKEYSAKEDNYGREYLHHEDTFTKTIHHVIDSARKHFEFTPERYLKLMESLKSLTNLKESANDTELLECKPDHPNFFKSFANSVAKVRQEFEKVETQSYCFSSVRFYWISDSDTQVTLYISSYNKQHPQCSDGYVITTGRTYHFAEVLTTGVHKVTFKNLSQFELDFIKFNGIQAFRFCDSMVNIIPDLVMTASLFIGGLGLNPNIPFFGSHVPMYMQELNVEFIKRANGYQWKKRNAPLFLKDYAAENFRSGDYLLITRFDGLDNIIHYGSGSHNGHSTMALWERSQDPKVAD